MTLAAEKPFTSDLPPVLSPSKTAPARPESSIPAMAPGPRPGSPRRRASGAQLSNPQRRPRKGLGGEERRLTRVVHGWPHSPAGER